MAKPIKIVINGPAGERTDAPTTEDFLSQIRDFLDVLQGVEKAALPEQSKHLVWRVTDATMNSPITLELTPFGDGPAADVAAPLWVIPIKCWQSSTATWTWASAPSSSAAIRTSTSVISLPNTSCQNYPPVG